VKILYDREEEFACLSPRQSARTRVYRAATRRSGSRSGASRSSRQRRVRLVGRDVPDRDAAPRHVALPRPGGRLLRAPRLHEQHVLQACAATEPEVTWPIESNLDELAEAAASTRSSSGAGTGTSPARRRRWPPGDDVRSRRVPREDRRELGWREKRGRGRAEKRGVGLRVGRSRIASLVHVGGSGRLYARTGAA